MTNLTEHVSEDALAFYALGETDGRHAIDHHLAECALCRAEHRAIVAALAATDALQLPVRSPTYGEEVWARVGPLLSADAPGATSRWMRMAALFRPGPWAVAAYAGAVALLLAVLGTPDRSPLPVPTSPAPGPASVGLPDPAGARERVLLASLGDHFDRSQRVLLELANAPEAVVEPPEAREWAKNLLADNRLYRQTAQSVGEPRLVIVLDDLERTLLEIAHGPGDATARASDAPLIERMDARDMLFKLRVATATVREREEAVTGGL